MCFSDLVGDRLGETVGGKPAPIYTICSSRPRPVIGPMISRSHEGSIKNYDVS